MPLMSFSGEQAFANLRSDRSSLWPDGRRDGARLTGGVAQVQFKPSFELIPGGEAAYARLENVVALSERSRESIATALGTTPEQLNF